MDEAMRFTIPETGRTYFFVAAPPGGFFVRDAEDGENLARLTIVTGKVRNVEQYSSDIDDASLLRIAEAFAASRR